MSCAAASSNSAARPSLSCQVTASRRPRRHGSLARRPSLHHLGAQLVPVHVWLTNAPSPSHDVAHLPDALLLNDRRQTAPSSTTHLRPGAPLRQRPAHLLPAITASPGVRGTFPPRCTRHLVEFSAGIPPFIPRIAPVRKMFPAVTRVESRSDPSIEATRPWMTPGPRGVGYARSFHSGSCHPPVAAISPSTSPRAPSNAFVPPALTVAPARRPPVGGAVPRLGKPRELVAQRGVFSSRRPSRYACRGF